MKEHDGKADVHDDDRRWYDPWYDRPMYTQPAFCRIGVAFPNGDDDGPLFEDHRPRLDDTLPPDRWVGCDLLAPPDDACCDGPEPVREPRLRFVRVRAPGSIVGYDRVEICEPGNAGEVRA